MRVQIHLRAEKLGNISRSKWRNKKSNPYATITSVDGSTNVVLSDDNPENNVVGCTEVCHNTLSPRWATIFTVEYDEIQQWTPLRITIRDSREHRFRRMRTNNDSSDVARVVHSAVSSSHDGKMGEVDVEVGEILNMDGQERKCLLNEGGCLYVHVTPSIPTQSRGHMVSGIFQAQIRGLDFKNIESGLLGLGAIDPYFELSKRYHDPKSGVTRWHLVYRSEGIHNIINPYWDPFQVDLSRLCHGDLKRELKFSLYDYEKKSSDRWLGEVEVTVEELMDSVTRGGNASRDGALRVVDDRGQVVGLLVVLKAEVSP
ncbi:hypothetical protein HJC23_004267 [Cyclotella cryptica]|uniref:C2 domain-containing protein n=1 Tax=Cyclotella cryptica TaxID=29204 RepID=A0ABD3PHL2_9STRA